MRMKIYRERACFLLCLMLALCWSVSAAAQEKIPVRVLILPKFEVEGLSGDYPGEAQLYYEAYLAGGDEYSIPGGPEGNTLYVKDGVALAVTGMGKVNAALTVMSVLTDDRFDFSRAYVLSTGCAGSARDTTVMGDVFVITAAVDYDLGHHADIREMNRDREATWFHDSSYDDAACVLLDPAVTGRVWALLCDLPVRTTEKTRSYMAAAFEGEEWALRNPAVLRGTTISGDNYWKGAYGHRNALLMTETYACPDPYVTTEMEDVAIALAMKRLGMLDRLIILRGSVNIDVFMLDNSPETLWGGEERPSLATQENPEAADIFPVAMENIFLAGSVVIDAILSGEF